jgi:hypothetical protein
MWFKGDQDGSKVITRSILRAQPMMNINKDAQMQHRKQLLPTRRQNENFSAAVKTDLTMRSSQKF